MNILSLGYLRVESPDAAQWAEFGPNVLGMALSDDPLGRADTVALAVDDRPSRLQVSVGETNRLECLGWELANAEAFHRAVAEMRAAGVEVTRGDDRDRARAQVRDLAHFTDPAGFRHELYWGPLLVPRSFHPGRPMSGFVTGDQGLGHAVLVVPNRAEAVRFFCDVLGFSVSDEIDMWDTTIVFFHVNQRHHSLAVVEMPGMRGLHHLMLQVNALDDVGSAHDICADRGIPLAMTLGRHTNDRMFSFYLRSPGGFEVEYGWGADTLDDQDTWVVTHMRSGSIWGHRPGAAGPPGCVEPVEGAAPAPPEPNGTPTVATEPAVIAGGRL